MLEVTHGVYRAVAGLGGAKVDPLVIDRPGQETAAEPQRRNNPRAFAAMLRQAISGGTDV